MRVIKIIRSFFRKNQKRHSIDNINEANRFSWIKNVLLGLPEGSSILDAGAGEQPFKQFCKHLIYVSQDFGEYKPEVLDSGLQMETWDYGNLDIVSDIASIPEQDSSYDAILCTEVLEHIINPRDALVEFSRLLKSGGYLILTAPFCSLTHFAPYHYYSGFSKFFYQKELEKNGFELIEMEPNGNYFEYMIQEINRIEYVAKKYSNSDMSDKERESIIQLKKTLKDLSMKDEGSEELLCFGFHVLAKKK